MLLRVINPLDTTPSTRPLRFANATQDAHRTEFLTLGNVTITNGTAN